MIEQTLSPAEWLSSHIALIGWPALVGFVAWFCWKARGAIDKFVSGLASDRMIATHTRDTIAEVKDTVDTIKMNHLAHVEKDMSTMASQQEQANRLLQQIATGIAVLVDRKTVL